MGTDHDQLLSLDELRDLWNAQADAANSWDTLGADEMVWWAQRQALALAGLLADGPAVPEGREPASVVREPSDEELLEIARTVDLLMEDGSTGYLDFADVSHLVAAFARAVLARFGHHSPGATKMVGPAEGEVAELVAWLRGANWDSKRQTLATRAADLLEQFSSGWVVPTVKQAQQLAPVPVAEWPWEQDGWCDQQGRCWMGRPLPDAPDRWDWSSAVTNDNATHCLPHDVQTLPTDADQPPA